MTNELVIGVIEWSGGSSEPSVVLGTSVAQVERQLCGIQISCIDQLDYIDDEWREEHPIPDLENTEAVAAWMAHLREATTDGWVTIFTAGDKASGRTFLDARELPWPNARKTYDHRARPDDDPEPGNRCRDCGNNISWVGPSQDDWLHRDEQHGDLGKEDPDRHGAVIP